VVPTLREYRKQLGLNSHFGSNAPVSLVYSNELRPVAVSAAE